MLAALRREKPDHIPWIEGIVNNGIASAVCGEPINVDWSVAPDGFPTMPGDQLAEEQKKVNRVLGKDNINFSAFAPIFAHKMERADDGSPVIVGDGKVRTRSDFEAIFKLPPADDPGFIANAREFIAHKGDYCACACVRLGIGACAPAERCVKRHIGRTVDRRRVACRSRRFTGRRLTAETLDLRIVDLPEISDFVDVIAVKTPANRSRRAARYRQAVPAWI